MPRLTDQSQEILEGGTPPARRRHAARSGAGITVGISLTNLENADRIQLTLTEDWRPDALDAALDEARDRYGADAVKRRARGRAEGISIPLLPD